MTSLILDLTETAIRNARRDEGKYEILPPFSYLPTIWGMKRIGAPTGERLYTVRLDEAGVPFRCSCPAAKKAEAATGENICKHQWILAEHLRIVREEEIFENRHEADFAGRF